MCLVDRQAHSIIPIVQHVCSGLPSSNLQSGSENGSKNQTRLKAATSMCNMQRARTPPMVRGTGFGAVVYGLRAFSESPAADFAACLS